jgi:thioredoxin-like negative regulator of GroEL
MFGKVFSSLLLLALLAVVSSVEFDLDSFKLDVVNDDRVWLVEFYSTMCGSCKEFSAVWKKLDQSMRSISTAQINIDEPHGMAIAKALDVLDEGIPNVRLLNSRQKPNGVSIMTGKNLIKRSN